jgi:flagellar P-ring protein precursor FlgI
MLTAMKGPRPARARAAFAVLLAGAILALSGAPAPAGDTVVARAAGGPTGGDNLLYGVGLVIGLSGTGDSAVDPELVEHSIVGVLRRAGIEPWRDAIAPGKVAAVTLSAELPDNAPDGGRIEVRIMPIGNARSLAGGTLLVAPLHGSDGVVYALGQGPVVAGSATAASVLKAAAQGTSADARLAAGAVVQRHLLQSPAAAGMVAQN